MRKTVAAVLLGTLVLIGAMVTAQETTTQPAIPRMQGMSPMMGKGMMGQRGQMGQMDSMMQRMQGMMEMMDACARMMGSPTGSAEEGKK